MTTTTLPNQPSFLKKQPIPGVTVSNLLVVATMVFGLALHLYNIDSIGDSNAYYTAAVKSMLQSWSNFFFVAAEPGGSVTVDKPPLGLWIEAVFAYFLGVSGFSTSLPNILAGVFGIPLLYVMVKKYMGELAGLVAAFIMAITPVFIATNRNNTMDGMLVFFLLLAAWAFIRATETGQRRWLFLAAFIVGLGFNIKMLQAFLPLPAFYALYFFGSKEGWLRKVINLGIATIILVAVSLSWAIAVDLTPADQRPYIGSSDNNTMMGLIFGHNGVSRLESNRPNDGNPGQTTPGQNSNPNQQGQPQPLNQGQQQRQGPAPQALDACANSTQGASCSFTTQNGNTIDGSCITPPNLDQLACAPQGLNPQNTQSPVDGQNFNNRPDGQGPNGQNGGSQFNNETGEPGALRFFSQPLSKQMSWLLPFALISVAIALFGSKIQLPVESGIHKALILWGGWLLTCLIFFSMVSGIFHAYYAIMLAPPLGAMVGVGFAQLWSWSTDKKWVGIVLASAAGVTIAFQYFATIQYNETSLWLAAGGLLLGLGIIFLFIQRRLAYVTLLAAMLVVPMYWTIMTTVTDADQNLPTAYAGNNQNPDSADRARRQDRSVDTEFLAYLEANTQDTEYLVAVPSSHVGSDLVLETGRPVLFMGGFGGQDDVVTADDLSTMVANGELKYILYGGDNRGNKAELTNWIQSSCTVVPEFSNVTSGGPGPQAPNQADGGNGTQGQGGPGRPDQANTLYVCK